MCIEVFLLILVIIMILFFFNDCGNVNNRYRKENMIPLEYAPVSFSGYSPAQFNNSSSSNAFSVGSSSRSLTDPQVYSQMQSLEEQVKSLQSKIQFLETKEQSSVASDLQSFYNSLQQTPQPMASDLQSSYNSLQQTPLPMASDLQSSYNLLQQTPLPMASDLQSSYNLLQENPLPMLSTIQSSSIESQAMQPSLPSTMNFATQNDSSLLSSFNNFGNN